MKQFNTLRRKFIGQASVSWLGIILTSSFKGSKDFKFSFGNAGPSLINQNTLEDISFEQLYKQYKYDLFERYLPNMEKFVIDHQYGGFMCSINLRNSKLISSEKKVWSEGRGIWVYSFLYNQFGQNSDFLEVARRSKDFILKHRPMNNEFWPSSYFREGMVSVRAGDIYGNLYLSEGLIEFAKASGKEMYLKLAKKIILSSLDKYDQIDYKFPISYGPPKVKRIDAPRVLGHWMVFLRSATQFLEYQYDLKVENLANRCVEAIIKYHLDPKSHLLIEGLNHDFSIPENDWSEFAHLTIGIQALWIVMVEAIRINDMTLFNTAKSAFKRHVQVAVDPVYGGYFHSLENIANNTFKTSKVLSVHEEILIGTLLIFEHTGDSWAWDCFLKTYLYVQEKFYHPEYIFPVESGDRKMIKVNIKGMGNYHHPRQLMLNLLTLKRLMEKNQK